MIAIMPQNTGKEIIIGHNSLNLLII